MRQSRASNGKVALHPQARTRVANGKTLFIDSDVDGRTVIGRRFRELHAQMAEDIGGDPSEAQNQIIRRAASLAVWCESHEAKLAAGEALDITTFTTACNALRRLLADLGLERRARDITPSLSEYLASKARNHAEAD